MHSHRAKMIGKYVKERRDAKGFYQNELAVMLGISAQFMGRIEDGSVSAPEEILIKLIKILDLKESRMVKIYKEAGEKHAEDLLKQAKPRSNKKRTENQS